ncbi:MAG: sialate O-acetylesterase [Akkermansiaceae bacterium]|nr:sialate O-acetylesterase [Akkermansiaceae bacterium]
MKRLFPFLLVLFVLAGLQSASATGKLKPAEYLHPLFSDHAVLQRGVPVPVWGQAEPNASLIVSFAGQTKDIQADARGHWSCTLDPMNASFEGRVLSVANLKADKEDAVSDILVGDVWLCSGQSNMEWGITKIGEDEEVAQANHPHLRLLTIPHKVAFKPQTSFESEWNVCSPEALKEGPWGGFSAVAYFFGKKLQEELKVPIGLVHSSWGGTMIEAWMSTEALQAWYPTQGQMKVVRKIGKSNDANKALNQFMDEWFQKHDIGTQQGWHKGTVDTSDWKEVDWPNSWNGCGIKGHEGITWIQRDFDLPKGWDKQVMDLKLGTIADTDTTWINGVEVGRTNSFEQETRYRLPIGMLKPGKNTITLRITNAGGGGIHDTSTDLWLKPFGFESDGETLALNLGGKWKLKTTATKAETGRPIVGNPRVATVLYNGMIAPLVPAAFKGVIWYQGEANASRPDDYAKLLPMMIADWREQFDRGDMAFHIVSLASYMKRSEEPRDHGWAGLREAQAMTAKKVPHCGLAVTIDIGDATNIHPKNKRDVGLRLALSALERTYGKDVVGSGPWYREMKIEDGKIRLEFDYAEGLKFVGDTDKAFSIAGEDGNYVWADAKIEGSSVIVSSPEVPQPIAVRYAWDANPQAPLYNAADLPAVPFRADGR